MKKATIAKLLVVCLIASLLCIPAGAAASEPTWVKGEGSTYSMSLTKDGTVDTSKLANATYTVNAGVYKLSVSGTVLSGVTLKATYGSAKTELFTVVGEATLSDDFAAQKGDTDKTYTITGSVTLKEGATFKYLTSLVGEVTVNVADNLTATKEVKSDTTTYEDYTYYTVTDKTGGGNTGDNTGGGSTGGGTTTPNEPTDTKQPVKPTVDEDKGTASATMSNSDASKMVNNAVKNKSDNVIVTVDVPEGVDVTEVSATIPASAVKGLAEKTSANLIIETPVASITLPNAALKDLGAASGTLTYKATRNDEENTVTIALFKNNDEPMTSISGGFTARVSLPEEKNKVGTVAILVMPDGTEKVLTKSVTKDGGLIVPLDGSATIKYVDNSKTFDDEIPSWSQNAVDFVTSRKLFNGTTETTFDAEVKMNRAMLVTVLHRLENTPAGGTPAFGDVNSGEWYAEAVAWASSNEIVMGVGDGFAPDGAVTREQIATFLYRYAKVMGVDTTPNKALTDFDDGADTSDWAQEAMQWAVGAGLIQGYGEGSLNPKGDATRAEVAQILMKLVNYMTTGSVE